MEHFFSPNSSGNLRSDAHHSQIVRGDADEDHTHIIGRDTVKLLGGIYPPGFRHPWALGLVTNNHGALWLLTDNQGSPGPLTNNQGAPGSVTDYQGAPN